MNRYLEKVALNKFEAYIAANLDKFPMAARKELADKGMVRSLLQVARGNKKRDLKLLQQTGGTLRLNNLEGAGVDGSVVTGRAKGLYRTHEVAELLEKAENDKLLQNRLAALRSDQVFHSNPVKSFNPGSFPVPVNAEVDRFVSLPDKWLAPQAVRELVAKLTKQHVASHHNLAVLGRESNALRENLYPEVLGSGIARERELSSEAELLERVTGKRFGVDKFTNQDLRKLRVLPEQLRDTLAVYSGKTEPAELRAIPTTWGKLRAWSQEPSPFEKYVRTKVRE